MNNNEKLYYAYINCCDGPIRHGRVSDKPISGDFWNQADSEEEVIRKVGKIYDLRIEESDYCPHYTSSHDYKDKILKYKERYEKCKICPKKNLRTGNVNQCQFYEELENWLFGNGTPGEPGVAGK